MVNPVFLSFVPLACVLVLLLDPGHWALPLKVDGSADKSFTGKAWLGSSVLWVLAMVVRVNAADVIEEYNMLPACDEGILTDSLGNMLDHVATAAEQQRMDQCTWDQVGRPPLPPLPPLIALRSHGPHPPSREPDEGPGGRRARRARV